MDVAPIEEELCELIRQDWEDPRYEVKGPMTWDEANPDAIGLIKDVLALANSGGGSLVIGISEEAGRLEFRGLTPEQLESWDPTRFGAKVNRYADPPIQCSVRVAECDGNSFVLVLVPGFTDSPHFCTRDYQGKLSQKTLYIRTANSASAPVNDTATFRRLVNQVVAARQDEIARIVRSAISGAEQQSVPQDAKEFREIAAQTLRGLPDQYEGQYPGFIVNVMYPARFQANRYTVQELQQAVEESSTPQYFYGSFLDQRLGAPVVLNDGLISERAWQGMHGADFYVYWRFFESGLLIHKELLFEDARYPEADRKFLFVNYFVQRIFIALDALVRVYEALGVTDEEVTWRLELLGSDGRELRESDVLVQQTYVSRETSVTFTLTHSIEDWRISLDDHVVEVVQRILQVFQFDRDFSASARNIIQQYRRGQV